MLGGLDFEKIFFPMPFVSSAPVNSVAAFKVVGGTTSVVTVTSNVKGAAYNGVYAIVLADPGKETAKESVAVTTAGGVSTITVTMRSVSGTLSTGAEVEAAINANAAAAALVTASDGGVGEMEAAASAALVGGVDGTVGMQGDIVFDATYLYLATADMPLVSSDGAWKRVALGSVY